MEVEIIVGVKISGLKKSFQVNQKEMMVLRDLNLELAGSEITVLLGKSGCGKTTLLRVIAGLEEKDGGEIEFSFQKRPGIVFQEPRLMPWMNVRKNIAFGLKKQETDMEKITQMIKMTGLSCFENAYPSQLSGGMQQRAALARALVCDTPYILMDEPFAALDYFTRDIMQKELLRIQREQQRGILFVTHSIDEALTLGDKIVILEQGKCKSQYDLSGQSQPRDLLSEENIQLKKKILREIGSI